MGKEQSKVHENGLSESYRKFSDVIGREATLMLVDAYGGEYFYIPKRDAIDKIDRNLLFFQEFQSGTKVRSLARKYGLSLPAVYEVINRALGKT